MRYKKISLSISPRPVKQDAALDHSDDYRSLQFNLKEMHDSGSVWRSGTGVSPVNHAQDARATIRVTYYQMQKVLDEIGMPD